MTSKEAKKEVLSVIKKIVLEEYKRAVAAKKRKGSAKLREGFRSLKEGDDFDSDAVRELCLFAENDPKMYRSLINNYLNNMLSKKKRGVYDHDLAIKLLEYYYSNYVRPEYRRQFGADIRLNPSERREFAEYFVNFLEETDEFKEQQTATKKQ